MKIEFEKKHVPVGHFERQTSHCPLYMAWLVLDEAWDYFRTEISENYAAELAQRAERVFARHPSCPILASVIIGTNVTYIPDAAFSDCSNLTSVTIPDSVTEFGNDAFYGCVRLAGLIIPDSVISIDDYAFSGCSDLTNIMIPDSVTSITDPAERCVHQEKILETLARVRRQDSLAGRLEIERERRARERVKEKRKDEYQSECAKENAPWLRGMKLSDMTDYLRNRTLPRRRWPLWMLNPCCAAQSRINPNQTESSQIKPNQTTIK